jgi:hypothetical protein
LYLPEDGKNSWPKHTETGTINIPIGQQADIKICVYNTVAQKICNIKFIQCTIRKQTIMRQIIPIIQEGNLTNTHSELASTTMKVILMCGIPCIFVYDINNHTNTCTIHFNKKVNCARVGVIIDVFNGSISGLKTAIFLRTKRTRR